MEFLRCLTSPSQCCWLEEIAAQASMDVISVSRMGIMGLCSMPKFQCLEIFLGIEPFEPRGLSHLFCIGTWRVGSKWCVSFAQVRPFQISRTAFSLIPNKNATCTGDGRACIEAFAASLIWKISMACVSLSIALGLDLLVIPVLVWDGLRLI